MTKFNRQVPVMALKNQSSVVDDATVESVWLPALQKQIDRDFWPAWGLPCKLVFVKGTEQIPLGAMAVILRDTSDEAGALGYHWTELGLPVTYVFAKDDMADGAGVDGVTSTLSHEIMEMLVDPGVNLYAIGFDPKAPRRGHKRKALFPYEVCDPVQGNRYRIDTVAMSDFIFPEWFEPDRKAGEMAMNQTGTLHAPFALDVNGYVTILINATTWVDRWGEERTKKPGRHRSATRAKVIGMTLAPNELQ